jgi:benzylsuccinate CoA-transferase BbsE subunit
MISSYRVLDLSDDRGTVCGQILAQLGAEVIKVEPPGGSPERALAPFAGNIEHPEKSLFWLAFNRGKKSITLDYKTTEGKDLIKKLVTGADIVIESFEPGYMDSIGLGYSILKEINPAIIVVSISPFGQTGPYKDYKGPDIVVDALSGYMYLCGYPDRAPVRVSFPLSYGYAGAQGAAGSLIALYSREMTGEGQYIDVSAQEGLTEYTLMAPLFWKVIKQMNTRSGQLRGGSSRRTHEIWQCKDGWVTFGIYGGQLGGRVNTELTMWMKKEGLSNEFVESLNWEELDMATIPQEDLEKIEKTLETFFLQHTMAELYDGSIQRKINLCPIWTPREILSSVQLKARGFWEEVRHDELGMTATFPGRFFKSTAMPEVKEGKRSPMLGEHNNEIFQGELGLSSAEIVSLKEKGII